MTRYRLAPLSAAYWCIGILAAIGLACAIASLASGRYGPAVIGVLTVLYVACAAGVLYCLVQLLPPRRGQGCTPTGTGTPVPVGMLAHSTDSLLHLCTAATMPRTMCGLPVTARPQVSTRHHCSGCYGPGWAVAEARTYRRVLACPECGQAAFWGFARPGDPCPTCGTPVEWGLEFSGAQPRWPDISKQHDGGSGA